MRLELQWIWPLFALFSICHALKIYSKSYPTNMKYENQRDWFTYKNLYMMATSTPQPEVKSKQSTM